MAYGSELFLGFVGEQAVDQMVSGLGLSWDTAYGDKYILEDARLNEIQSLLKIVHKDALQEMGLTIIEHSKLKIKNNFTGEDNVSPESDHVYVQAPDGTIHELSVWQLSLDYDPREMGHTPEDMLIGVSLISRYFPVFLDWMKESGGSGDTISLTPDVLANIEIARKHLAKVLPFIQHAPIVFREIHY